MKPIDAGQPGGIQYLIVADDLTGACDSAVAFTGRGMIVEIPLEREIKTSSGGVVAVSTESRDIPEEAAIERVRQALLKGEGAREVFKKIDSVLRGNTFAEIRAAAECFPCDLVVLSPAYPAMGRTVKNGVLRITDGIEDRAIDLQEGLRRVGLGNVVVSAKDVFERRTNSMRDAINAGRRLIVCDAETEEDLQAIVKTARNAAERILWIGSGGLAHALANDLPKSGHPGREEAGDGCVLLFIGSDHAVTSRQVEALKRGASAVEMVIEERSKPLRQEVVILRVSRGVTTKEQVQQAVMGAAPHGIRACLLTGGDTAAFVCEALGARSLRLTEEFAPGLPLGVAQDGVLDGVPVVLKSGGFGSEDVLCAFADRFAGRREFV